jgi:hypothetical protein
MWPPRATTGPTRLYLEDISLIAEALGFALDELSLLETLWRPVPMSSMPGLVPSTESGRLPPVDLGYMAQIEGRTAIVWSEKFGETIRAKSGPLGRGTAPDPARRSPLRWTGWLCRLIRDAFVADTQRTAAPTSYPPPLSITKTIGNMGPHHSRGHKSSPRPTSAGNPYPNRG